MRPVIVWFRRDLRIRDNPALWNATHSGAPIIPLFIFDQGLIRRLPSDGAVFDFQAKALEDLAGALRGLGGDLILRSGRVLEIHRRLMAEAEPAALYFNRDYEPAGRSRDADVEALYASAGIPVHTFQETSIHGPEEVLTGDGRPYVVFTPYARSWRRLPLPDPLPPPSSLSTPALPSSGVLRAAQIGRKTLISSPAASGGEREAGRRWARFRSGGLSLYAARRDIPGEDGTSRLSPFLRFGCISVREMARECRAQVDSHGAGDGGEKFLDELIWRDFYQAVLSHFPRLTESSYREEFDRMRWRFDEGDFAAWREGRTGFPLVDAGMRQLARTGWMHNRVRMVAASFLTKDLLHDWRLGAAVFEEQLLDIETASNIGGWQWSASAGVDPRPMRIFNPRLQSERFDPEGAYLRRFIPELQRVPALYIHSPSEMPPAVQKEAGCLIGRDYPAPIVDHREAAARFRKAFLSVRG
ncbi:MAG: deoxyribodipyrimidine photo-lyase [Bacteroidota bacterium]